ncbi:MAG: hypothetical protein ISR47_00905 [Rhodospirillales bacterium]|nr:hypothetical protein [Rhodospirillales bacterium]
MTSLIGGAEVELLGTKHKLDAPIDIQSYIDYVGGYFFSQLNPGDMERRMQATAEYFGVPALAEAAEVKKIELESVSEALNFWFGTVYGGETLSRTDRNKLATTVISQQRHITEAIKSGYALSRASGFGHEAAKARAGNQIELTRKINQQYAIAIGTGLSEEDAMDIATGEMGKVGQHAFRSFRAAGFSEDAAMRHGLGKVNVEALQKDIMADSAHWGLPIEDVRELTAARMAVAADAQAGEAELKAMMLDPRYSDALYPDHLAYRQMIADGFRAAFGG